MSPDGAIENATKNASEDATGDATGDTHAMEPKDDLPEMAGMRFYVTGESPRSVTALTNLHRICEEHLEGHCQLEVIDLLVHPAPAPGDGIVAVPALVRIVPAPIPRMIGDLSDTDKVLVGLQLCPLVGSPR